MHTVGKWLSKKSYPKRLKVKHNIRHLQLYPGHSLTNGCDWFCGKSRGTWGVFCVSFQVVPGFDSKWTGYTRFRLLLFI